MILIQVTTSEGCRGWEGNSTEYVEFDGTLRQFITQELFDWMSEEDIENALSGKDHNETGYGIVEDGSEENGYHYEGEESTVSYEIVTPTKEFIETLMKYVK